MTNQVNQAFEKFYGEYQLPLVKDALVKYESGEYKHCFTRDALAIWQAATQASEQRIKELEADVARLNFISATLKSNIVDLTASNNRLREVLVSASNYVDKNSVLGKIIASTLSSTPAQSLAEHDNAIYEKIANELDNKMRTGVAGEIVRAMREMKVTL